MVLGIPATIEVAQSYPQIIGSIYVIDQETIAALGINFQEEQFDDRYTPKQKIYARKSEDVQLPKALQKKPKYPEPKVLGSINQGHTKQYKNRRLHQDNTKPR